MACLGIPMKKITNFTNMENTQIIITGKDIAVIEAMLAEMPYKFALPLINELNKHIKPIEVEQEEVVTEDGF